MRTAGVVLAESIALGTAELRTLYTLRSWLAGWLVRMLAQVAFFASFGLLLDSTEHVRYLLVGNAVVLVCVEATIVVLSVSAERYHGTLEALVASPARVSLVFLTRGLHWIGTGVVTSTVTLAVLLPLFGQPVPPLALLTCMPVLVVIGVTSHLYGCALGAITLRFPQMDWLVLNLGYLLVMTLAGVNVAVDFWPAPLSALARVLPVTHGLEAVRTVLDGGPAGQVAAALGLEVAVGIGWGVVAVLAYELLLRRARHRAVLTRV